MTYSIISMLLAVGALPLLEAEEAVQMRVTKAAVFKNGYSQVSLCGDINTADTQLEVSGMPVPILGSFWWKAPQGSNVQEVRSETVTRNVPKQNYSTLDFLLANAGQQAEIVLANGAKIEGIIHTPEPSLPSGSFLKHNEEEPSENQEYDNLDAESESLLKQRARAEIDLVQLRTTGGFITLRERNILYAEVKTPTPQLPTSEQKVNTLVFELDAPATGKELQVSGLCRGLSWLPSYRMDLGRDGKALFQCKAMIMNELADLNNVQLELVMGYPALGKYLLPSPVAQQHSLFGFLKELSSEDSQSSRREIALTNNNSGWYQAGKKSDSSDLTQAEDLFFYAIPNLSCATGQTVTRELFCGEVSYSHVYTWNIPTQSDIQRWQESRRSHYGSEVSPPNEVWHCVKVHNSLKMPWTGGVLDCYAEGRLVGRTEMTFTADGGSTLVRLNKTMQAPVQFSETILKENGDVLTMEGKLSLTNYSDKEMHVIITKEVSGTPLSASDAAATTCSPNYYKNPDGRFVWEVCVQPGETKTVTYQYSHKE